MADMGIWEGMRAAALWAGLLWVTCAMAQPTTRPAVPPKGQLTVALRQIEELQARGERTAAGLLELSRKTTSSAALRYTAAERAMQLAGAAGDVPVAVGALDEICASFDVDRLDLQAEMLTAVAGSKRRGSAAILAMRWMNDAYATGRMELANRFAEIITSCQSDLSESLRPAAERHLEDHAAAKRAAGGKLLNPSAAIYRCLYQQQWSESLPQLVEGEFAELAQQDMAATDQQQRIAVADAWWQRSQSSEGMKSWRIASRAVQIYSQVLPRVDGVEREVIAGRIAEHQRRLLLEQGYLPGAIRDIWREAGKDRRSEVAQDLELARDEAGVELPKKDGHVRWRGQLLIELPGRHEFIFTGGSAMRVTIDGIVHIDNPTAYNKRSGIKLPLELSPGMHSFDIEVSARSSTPRLSVEWITPGNYQRLPVPAAAIFHDSLLLQ